MIVFRYSMEKLSSWNEFAANAKNRHFMFQRGYMEYHEDRFEDCSLMIYDDKARLVALLPATKDGDMCVSHGGLTFGGFLVDARMSVEMMLLVFDCVMDFCGRRAFVHGRINVCRTFIISAPPKRTGTLCFGMVRSLSGAMFPRPSICHRVINTTRAENGW